MKRKDLKSSFADAEYRPNYILSFTATARAGVPRVALRYLRSINPFHFKCILLNRDFIF